MTAEDFLNNPIRWSLSEFLGLIFKKTPCLNEKFGRTIGKVLYYGTEIAIGYKGIKSIGSQIKKAGGFRKVFFRCEYVRKSENVIPHAKQSLKIGTVTYYTYQVKYGIYGLKSYGENFYSEGKELVKQPLLKSEK